MKPMKCEKCHEKPAAEQVSVTGEPAEHVFPGVAEGKRGPRLLNLCAECADTLRQQAAKERF